MTTPPFPQHEAARLKALYDYDILDTPPEPAFDDLVHLASTICDAPMAAVSLIDRERQWFKARVGLDCDQTARDVSFCSHGIAQERELFIVPDARLDARFATSPLVKDEPNIRFYGGAQLVNKGGHALGMLCVLDREPRELSPLQSEALRIIARQVVAQLELHRAFIAQKTAINTIKKNRNELRKAHEELEDRIAERTEQLRAANQALQRAERAATDWKNRYDLVIGAAGLAIYDMDRATSNVVWSAGAASVLGLDPALVDRAREAWVDLVHPHDRAVVAESIAASLTTGQSFDVRYRLRHGSDHYRWIHDRGIVAPDAHGRCARVVGIIQDITQQKLADDTMREQAALLDQTQDAIMVRDLQNRVLYWNGTAERLYGWTTGEALGRPVQDLLLQGKLNHLPHAQEEALKTGSWSGEVDVFTKNGKQLTVRTRWTVLRDGDGAPGSILVTHTDLSEQKLLEAKFLRAQRLESLGALASGIAHDLNNIFTPILMSAQMLGDKLDETSRANVMSILQTSAAHGAEMVKQVLTFSRGLEAGPGLLQVKHLTRELEKMMRDTFPPQIKILTQTQADLWLVRGDATQLYQILMNLCVNSRDAMPKGGTLSVDVKNVEVDPPRPVSDNGDAGKAHVLITVSDTGIGITREVQRKMFEPFFTTKEPGQGTGLGLSTTANLVKAHGGWIEVDSKPGNGTSFSIFLPAIRSQSPESVTAADAPPDGNGELLLVVDDESSIREILKTTLEAHNYEVLLADDGSAALARYAERREKVSLVIMDLVMPVLDGHATIGALRKMNPEARILAVSGQSELAKLDRLAEDGRLALLSKPYSPQQLLRSIHNALNPFGEI